MKTLKITPSMLLCFLIRVWVWEALPQMIRSEVPALLSSQSLEKRYSHYGVFFSAQLFRGHLLRHFVTHVCFSPGVCPNEAVQGRAAGFLLDVCPLAAPQHCCSGHEGLLSCSGGRTVPRFVLLNKVTTRGLGEVKIQLKSGNCVFSEFKTIWPFLWTIWKDLWA